MNILLLGKVGDAISDGFRSLMFILCDLVYSLIAFTFKVFQGLGTAEIISAKEINVLFGRISLIIGLFMIFRVTFSFIQYIVDPDTMLDKKKGAGNIIVKIVVAVVLLGSTSSLFRFAYDVQNKIIESNVISNIIFGTSQDVSNFGAQLSANVFTSFYRLNDAINTDDANNDVSECIKLVTTDENGKNKLDEEIQSHDGKLNYTSTRKCLNKRTGTNDEYIDTTGNKKEYVIDFDGGGFMALLVGIAVLYLIMVYSIQVGVRVLQLAYLQIVAPIPIAMYITPKGEEQLKKWGSQCLTTFLDFFLRTAIIYFAVYAIDMLWRSNLAENLIATTNMSNNIFGKSYITIIMIIAILVFAKKIPNLIKEIFPSIGGAAAFNYGLSSPEMKKALTFGLGATAGAIGGAAIGFKQGKGTLTGRAGNAFTGFFRGAAGGAKTKGSIVGNVKKGMSSQRAASQKAYERNNDGSTFWGRTFGASEASITKEAFDKELSLYSDYNGVVDLVDKELEKDAAVQSAMARKQALLERGSSGGPTPTVAEIRNADALIKKAKKSALQVEIGRGTNGKIMSALANAEAIRAKGQEKGYTGFGTTSLATGSAADRMNAFFDNKDSTGIETNEIKGAGGSRNAEYKKAEANAKYNKAK